jgi:ferredoxin
MTAVGEARLPELDGARCVHAAIETASCRACVEVCPKSAWRLDDAALEFDSGQCDGCGLCVPACPRQAIVLPLALASRLVAGTNAMLAACDRAGGDAVEGDIGSVAAQHDQPGRIPCLHAIGLGELLRAYRAGQRIWLLAHADCTHCPRGQAERLSTRLSHINTSLRQRGRPVIVLREVSPAAWTTLIKGVGTAQGQARRGFFVTLSRRPLAALLGEPSETEQEHKPPGEYLPDGDDALMPWVIRLNPSRCVGCHACSRVCPEAAIQFDAETPAYRLRHRACTGCGMCQDVCQHHAVILQSWAEPTQTALPLVEQHCPRCGVAFHTPAESSSQPRFCWVCASDTRKRLFQVMTY